MPAIRVCSPAAARMRRVVSALAAAVLLHGCSDHPPFYQRVFGARRAPDASASNTCAHARAITDSVVSNVVLSLLTSAASTDPLQHIERFPRRIERFAADLCLTNALFAQLPVLSKEIQDFLSPKRRHSSEINKAVSDDVRSFIAIRNDLDYTYQRAQIVSRALDDLRLAWEAWTNTYYLFADTGRDAAVQTLRSSLRAEAYDWYRRHLDLSRTPFPAVLPLFEQECRQEFAGWVDRVSAALAAGNATALTRAITSVWFRPAPPSFLNLRNRHMLDASSAIERLLSAYAHHRSTNGTCMPPPTCCVPSTLMPLLPLT